MPSALGRYRDVVFFASGFAGLIYESIWTHYLKLFLGHAAYAQTLVLAIFMGGTAMGAAAVARHTARIRNPLRTYAVIEAAIGILALAFHPVFIGATDGFYDVAFAQHLGGIPFAAGKWGLATLLILPQSILLGATFPVFAAAATRDTPAAKGRSLATLYFANSLGGAVGVLASGFLLIPSVGLNGTIATAGAMNLAIAALVLWITSAAARVSVTAPAMAEAAPATPVVPRAAKATAAAATRAKSVRAAGKRAAAVAPAPAAQASAVAGGNTAIAASVALLLAASLLTGAASFIYEIGWIRMLSLVLGSATHSFELMLSSFILGLALGGLWIRKRIDTSPNPGMLLAYIQIAMGCAALATVPLHSASFDLFAFVVREAPRTDGGYALFNLVRYGVASLIMFPAAFCAGMTLPLVTRILYAQKGQGEQAIGFVYSANTIGAIIGLGLAIHVGLPVFGLEYLVASGAMIDILLGAALLIAFGGSRSVKYAVIAAIAGGVGTAAVAKTLDPQKLSSGVFRTGMATISGAVVEIAHGKTATVSVNVEGDLATIRTNGKPDASAWLHSKQYTSDQVTMTLIGAIPLMLHPDPRRVANIGFGSGITGETILGDPRVLHLDTIEIEPRMVDLAQRFRDLNRSVYQDPRSAIRIEDAKSFFAANGKTYDVIASEPSNPWVSGVSGLFSVEFYRHVSRYLNEDGLFAQWLQTYETDADRAISVLKAVDRAFDDYMVFALVEGDMLIVAKPHGKLALHDDAHARLSPRTRRQLRQLDIANLSDITFRLVGNKAMFKPFLDTRPVAANSDFVPYLDSNADRDRFLQKGWPDLHNLATTPFPIAETLGGRPPLATPSALSITTHFGPDPAWLPARLLKETLLGPAAGPDAIPIPVNLPEELARQGDQVIELCNHPPRDDRPGAAAILGRVVLPFLSPAEGRDVMAALGRAACLDLLPESQARWHSLLANAAARNAKEFGAVADQLLASGPSATDGRASYVLGMAMLGRIAAGDRARARAVWDQYAWQALGSAPPELALQILRAHSLEVGGQP